VNEVVGMERRHLSWQRGLEEDDQLISNGLIGSGRAGFGYWKGEIPLTKLNARRPAKGYMGRLLGGP
jgi:hypothetical protein